MGHNINFVSEPSCLALQLYDSVGHPCFDNPCENGGRCRESGDPEALLFQCSCHQAYGGDRCETLINPCALNPCQNGATCTNLNTTDYICSCAIEFTGANCETTIDHCALLNPNCNNGSCVDGFGTFTCRCDPGYTGDTCDDEIDECLTAGCQNGECEDLLNNFRCTCYTGWTGRLCHIDINYCYSSSISVFSFSGPGPCYSAGTVACVDGNSTYSCICASGFTGYNCAEDINECEENPCRNGGNCTNYFGRFECTCSAGFWGDTCSLEFDPCEPQPCSNGQSCIDEGVGLYSCDCNTCVTQCPIFMFGNHTVGECQPCKLIIIIKAL